MQPTILMLTRGRAGSILCSAALTLLLCEGPPFGDNSPNWTKTGGPDVVSTMDGTNNAYKYTVTIDPPLGSGVTANACNVKIKCGNQWVDVPADCLGPCEASGKIATVVVRKDGKCPVQNCANPSEIKVQWITTGTGAAIGVYTFGWPATDKRPKVSWEADLLPRQTTVLGITMLDGQNQVITTFTGDVTLTLHSIRGSSVSFAGGGTTATVPVYHGNGAVRVDLTNATAGDIVWVEASAPNADAHRAATLVY